MVYTTYKNGDDWGMVQMALFYPREFSISISSSFHVISILGAIVSWHMKKPR